MRQPHNRIGSCCRLVRVCRSASSLCPLQGIVDENTLVWGHGLADWLPIRNVRTLVCQIRTLEGAPRPRKPAPLRILSQLLSYVPPA